MANSAQKRFRFSTAFVSRALLGVSAPSLPLVRRILPLVSSASKSWREKRARAGWRDMNSKHKYISFARDGRWEYLPVIGEETWRSASGKSHRAAFVRFIASTRWHLQDFPGEKPYTWSYSKATRRYENVLRM